MGELIRREMATAPRIFTGERLTGAISGQVEIEHYHRYLLAREFCRGRDVLDVAAGEGYGTALLAQIARSAVGIEIDPDTVAAARAEFPRPNLRYEEGDARNLPLAEASVDVAISFETLEHLLEQDVFLAELRRVLRPAGLLIISTPDRDSYSPIGVPPNPFHLRELTRTEFASLVAGHFPHSTVVSQRALIGSVILGAGQAVPVLSFEKRSDALIEGGENLPRAPYLLAFASAAPLPPLPDSVYIERSDLDTDKQVRFEAEMARRAAEQAAAEDAARADAAGAHAKAAEARADAAEARAHSAEMHAQTAKVRTAETEEQLAAALTRGVEGQEREANARRTIEALELRSKDATERLAAMEASSSWRATRPFRRAGQRFPFIARYLTRGVKLIWWASTFQLPARYRMWRNFQQQQRHAPAIEDRISVPEDTPMPLSGDIRLP